MLGIDSDSDDEADVRTSGKGETGKAAGAAPKPKVGLVGATATKTHSTYSVPKLKPKPVSAKPQKARHLHGVAWLCCIAYGCTSMMCALATKTTDRCATKALEAAELRLPDPSTVSTLSTISTVAAAQAEAQRVRLVAPRTAVSLHAAEPSRSDAGLCSLWCPWRRRSLASLFRRRTIRTALSKEGRDHSYHRPQQ